MELFGMSMYKIGDKVQIVSSEELWNCSCVTNKMVKRAGTIMTIREAYGHNYYMVEDKDETNCNMLPGWIWSEKMIVGLAEEEEIAINKDDLMSFICT